MGQIFATRERLHLFVARVEQLKQLRLVTRQEKIEYSTHWDIISQKFTSQTVEPDEDDLRSFLLLFRQFISDSEPVFIGQVFNDCIRYLTDNSLIAAVKKAQEEWKRFFRKSGPFKIIVDNQNLTPEYVLDLWINVHYFHNDAEKRAKLNDLL